MAGIGANAGKYLKLGNILTIAQIVVMLPMVNGKM